MPSDLAAGFRLFVGLGNPGREYRDTRHNVGFLVLDRLAARERAEFRTEKGWQAEVARAGDLLLCKPLTFMNLSGQADIGFLVLDRLAARERAEFRTENGWQAEVARAGDLLLCKPLTFMNLSGQAV